LLEVCFWLFLFSHSDLLCPCYTALSYGTSDCQRYRKLPFLDSPLQILTVLKCLSALRHSIRTILEIAESNKEDGNESSSAKVQDTVERNEEWSDRVKGLLYKLVNTVVERL
jgi:hypothetical protein